MSALAPLIATAFLLGAVSGLSPGPLLALVVAESLRRGFRAGAAVSVAPLVTDAPIILAMTAAAGALSFAERPAGWLYLAGACYLVFLSVAMIRLRGMEAGTTAHAGASFLKGAAVNLLNPSPYLFWLAVGGPLLWEARRISWAAVPVFLGVFYGMLVGTKLGLAALIGKNRHLLSGRAYAAVLRCMGILLLVFAAGFARKGLMKLF